MTVSDRLDRIEAYWRSIDPKVQVPHVLWLLALARGDRATLEQFAFDHARWTLACRDLTLTPERRAEIEAWIRDPWHRSIYKKYARDLLAALAEAERERDEWKARANETILGVSLSRVDNLSRRKPRASDP